MKGIDVEQAVRGLAPYELAYEGEELGFVVGDPDREVTSIAVTWRPTVRVLEECVTRKADLLIIHEPLLQSRKATVIPIEQLRFPPNSMRESILRESGIAVLRAHSNWDDAPGGNNDTLAEVLRLTVRGRFPYGRVGELRERSLAQFAEHVKECLNCPHVAVVGQAQTPIRAVAIVSGSGNSLVEMIEIAQQKGADVLVSGDIQDSRARFAAELGIALIDAGGYYTETPGMKHLAQVISMEFGSSIGVAYLDPGPAWRIA